MTFFINRSLNNALRLAPKESFNKIIQAKWNSHTITKLTKSNVAFPIPVSIRVGQEPIAFKPIRTFATTFDRFQTHKMFKRPGDSMEKQQLENYGKLSSEAYSIWFPEKEEAYEDQEFYKQYIKDSDEPALEVGCGNGRLLIPYLQEGLNVEGLDLSPYMIDICRKRATEKGLSVKLYQQAMQDMHMPVKYGTIFVPYGSFMLLSDLKQAKMALNKFREHLKEHGRLIIPLFLLNEHDINIDAPKPDEWRLRREGKREDGAIFKCWEKASFDIENQFEHSHCRFEVFQDGKLVETEEESLHLRWYTQEEFHNMLKEAGFTKISCLSGYSDMPSKPDDSEFVFIAQR